MAFTNTPGLLLYFIAVLRVKIRVLYVRQNAVLQPCIHLKPQVSTAQLYAFLICQKRTLMVSAV